MSEKEKIVKSFQGLLKVGENEKVFNQLYELNSQNIELQKNNNVTGCALYLGVLLGMLYFIYTCIPETTPTPQKQGKTKTSVIQVSEIEKKNQSENEQIEQERCSKIGRNNPYGIKCQLNNCPKNHCVLDKKSGDYYVNFESEKESRKQWEKYIELNK
jgi:hypothetical protein